MNREKGCRAQRQHIPEVLGLRNKMFPSFWGPIFKRWGSCSQPYNGLLQISSKKKTCLTLRSSLRVRHDVSGQVGLGKSWSEWKLWFKSLSLGSHMPGPPTRLVNTRSIPGSYWGGDVCTFNFCHHEELSLWFSMELFSLQSAGQLIHCIKCF